MKISKVVFNPDIGRNIARVNRQTGVIELDPSIWETLPELERDFVLLHERGHMELQTASEFAANQYAIKNFIPVRTLTNKELGQRIEVVTRITNPDNYISYYNGVDPIGAIGEAVGKIFETLPVIGIGSKSRQKETEARAKAALDLENAKSSGTTKIAFIGGTLLIVMIVLFFALKN
jgi:hypothetical protein